MSKRIDRTIVFTACAALMVVAALTAGWLLTRISHQLPAAVGDAPHPAAFSRLGVLDVLSSTPPRPSGRNQRWARHLAALATIPGEIYGLAAALTPEPQPEPAAASQATEPDLPEFIPSERLPADSAVAFPVDI